MRSASIAVVLVLFFVVPAAAGDGSTFEVLVLGTYHAPTMFLSEHYTPGHIRATLANAKPDVVAVESHPDWFAAGRYHVVTYEAEGVAVPWARAKGLSAYGVDWKDIEAWDRMEEANALKAAEPLEAAFAASRPVHPSVLGKLPEGAIASVREHRDELAKVDWEHINGVHDDAWAKLRYGPKSPDQADFIGRRDRGIADNCVAVMKKHKGKRLVVVVGAAHKPFLDVHFGRMKSVRVLKLGRDVPLPTMEEIAAAWSSDDLVNALGHMFDRGSGYFHVELVDLPRARRLLRRLEAHGDRPDAARYFKARIYIHAGKAEEAEAELKALSGKRSKETLYPFPMRQWRMRFSLQEAVRVEQARLLLDRDRKKESRALVAPLAEELRRRLEAIEAQPRSPQRVEAIKDAGFEAGERASDFFAGWATYLSARSGMLRFNGDTGIKTEGKRSLRVEVTKSNETAMPFYVRQEISVPRTDKEPGRLTFGLSIRGRGVDSVTLSAEPAYYIRQRQALATQTVTLEPNQWKRAEVSFDLPPSRAFALYLRFKGAKGARLWLDGGTPLPVTYQPIHLEWSRVARAVAFLEWLMAGRPAGAKTAGTTGLKDPGFEEGLASMPLSGWYSGARKGALKVAADTRTKKQGKQALSIEVQTAQKGSPYTISQSGELPPGEEFELSISLRATKLSWARVTVGIWETSNSFKVLDSHMEPQGRGSWTRATLSFSPPKDKRQFGVYILFPGEAGGRIWLDDAKLERVR